MNLLFEEIYRTFGLELKTPKPKGSLESIDIDHEDGATEVMASAAGGIVGLSFDMFQIPTNEVELIKTYRTLSLTSDVDRILTEIRNEIFVFDEFGKKAIDIEFNSENKKPLISKSVMEKIKVEYDVIYNILDFQKKGLELFDRWYIDGRIFLHKIVDKDNLKDGIQKIIYIDPLKIKRVVEYPQTDQNGIYDLNKIKTYYVFSDIANVFSTTKLSRFMVINKDAIAYSDSGIYDFNTGAALSYLWKTIVPYNNMRMMEEALLVYRVVRSPERRAFYISVGNLSKPKAEQYIKELMAKFKNKLVYDARTGTIVDRKNVMSMVEDYWLPRRDDGKGTEIQTLPGATNLGTIDDVDLFRKKFLESSNIPIGRFKDETATFVFGRSTETSRDEFRFKKFLDRLRNRFTLVLEDILKTQLILKNIIVDTDWEDVKKSMYWVFAEDNNFVQWKEAEVLNSRLESVASIDPFVGKYFTRMWVMKNVMRMGDDEAQKLIEEADEEKEFLTPVESTPASTSSAETTNNTDAEEPPEEPTSDEESA
jgi:hypothetical protein